MQIALYILATKEGIMNDYRKKVLLDGFYFYFFAFTALGLIHVVWTIASHFLGIPRGY